MSRKSYSEINGDVIRTSVALECTLDRINELEEDKKIQEYIKLLSDYERLKREKENGLISLKEAEQYECNHLFVVGKKTSEDDLLEGEVVLRCLKCGVTSGEKYASEGLPNIREMRKIIHQTAHHGRLLSDKEVMDMEDIQKRYDSVKDMMSEEEISKVICESIRCQREHKKTLGK